MIINKQVLNFQEISLTIVYPVETFQCQDQFILGTLGHTPVLLWECERTTLGSVQILLRFGCHSETQNN